MEFLKNKIKAMRTFATETALSSALGAYDGEVVSVSVTGNVYVWKSATGTWEIQVKRNTDGSYVLPFGSVSATGAWTLGSASDTPYSSGYHTTSRSIYAQTPTVSSDNNGGFRIGSNIYHAAISPNRATSIGGGGVGFFPRTSDSTNSIVFYNNLSTDGSTAPATVTGGVTQSGSWTLGAANQMGFQMIAGDVPNQITSIFANCRTTSQSDARSFSTRGGGAVVCLAAINNTANCLEFYANQDDDGVDADADLIGYVLPTGAWTLGNINSSVHTMVANASPFFDMRNKLATGSARQMLRFYLGATGPTDGTSCGGVQTTDGTSSPSFFTGASDFRLKKDIQDAPVGALNRICSIKLRDFRLIEDAENSPLKRGVIAQELQEIYPEKVHTREDGFLYVSMGYDWEFIQSIQELAAQVEQLQSEIALLKGA